MYFGIIFKGKHGRKGGTHDAGEKRVAANRATHALLKRCYEMDLANANILSCLYRPSIEQRDHGYTGHTGGGGGADYT